MRGLIAIACLCGSDAFMLSPACLHPSPAAQCQGARLHVCSSMLEERSGYLLARDADGISGRPQVQGGESVAIPDADEAATTAAVMASLAFVVAVSWAVPAADATVAGVAAASAVPTSSAIFEKAARRALGGGVSGAVAGVAQVLLLMWLRTTMNYQYRNGGSAKDAMTALYEEGGIRRFYRGVSFALLQTPLSRFGDTASNSGVLALLATSEIPLAARTALAAGVAAGWRIGITPLDTLKTTLQVKGEEGYDQVMSKVDAEGVGVLWQGALANAGASFAGSYPWFLTYNSLNEALPAFGDELAPKLIRSACLGIGASGVSDCVSNSIRVLKTRRQTSEVTISYKEAAEQIIESDGWRGLFVRGLSTRLLTNALQAALFTVIWKLLEDYITAAKVFG